MSQADIYRVIRIRQIALSDLGEQDNFLSMILASIVERMAALPA